MDKISVILRTRNEEKWVGRVLERLFQQTHQNFEVIVVDSGSTDQTLEIVSKFPVKVIHIPSEEFTYPHALNVGISQSSGKYLAILSAHSIPGSIEWLAQGVRHFASPNVMGVYGPQRALPGSTIWDHVFHTKWGLREYIACFPRRYRIIRSAGMGVMGFTNAMIRRDLWEAHHFNEAYAAGGEDGEWANYWFEKNYVAVKDIDFMVYHSHNLSLSQWREQYAYWFKLGSPHEFKRLSYRKDGPHR